MRKVILSILGHDRTGIVAAVSKVLFEHNCNIENVSMTTLQFEFAGIFIVSMPANLTVEALRRSLETTVSPLGLDVHIARLVSTAAQAAQLQSEPFIITTIGPDRKGLMAGISEVIARHDGNITNLQAVIKGGDNSGDYIMIYEVDIPPQTDQQVLYQDLKNRAKELKLDIDIQHRNIFETMYRI
ncbi:MAG: ACT domain-containing protein [Desulfobacterales bacterium]|jgi:glycine cleavage system transcriptional repressor